ncbi:MAG: histidine--tRNA ligase [Bacilli bacterium]
MIIKPKGTIDLLSDDAKKWKYVNRIIDELMEKYNYNYIRTPLFESTDLFKRTVGESTDIVSKETYDFLDRGERPMTLRPEGTAGVVRSFIENKMYGDPSLPIKVYYNGTMYRYERPQSGRDREFTQFGVEVLGTTDEMVDAEIISIPVNLCKLLGLKGLKVKINSLGDQESKDKYKEVLYNYFKDKIEGLCPDCKARLEKNPLRILDCKVDKDSDILKNAPKMLDYLNEASLIRFNKVQDYLNSLEIDFEVDSNIVRGLDYYDHTVFELEANVKGFGSNNVLCGGGRYSKLIEELGGPSMSAMGFAIGLGRLVMALNLEEVDMKYKKDVDLFIIYNTEVEKQYAAKLINDLRLNGFVVEIDYLNRNIKGQFKQADRLNTKYYLILSNDDLINNEIKLKNSKTKKEEIVNLDYLLYFLEENIENEDLENEENLY